jgi:hypothetical protein
LNYFLIADAETAPRLSCLFATTVNEICRIILSWSASELSGIDNVHKSPDLGKETQLNISEVQRAADVVNMKLDIVREERVFIETTHRNIIEIIIAGKRLHHTCFPRIVEAKDNNLDMFHPTDPQSGGRGLIAHSLGQRPAFNPCHAGSIQFAIAIT